MLDSQTKPRPIAPLFSIIIPLEFHRGQWERCWQGWHSQTLDRAAFEIILVVPPNYPEREKLSELTGPAPRLEYSQHSHDINLCAVGAARARGKFLFFTGSHCWPEPDVLELCLQAFHANADWAAFSCKSLRISHNKLSDAEADMYETDIEYGMKIHPWRKILDQCFVTRREAYEKCGGLKPEFGHFSEWVLAASYFERGQKIGYLPEARIHHYYVGSLPELKTFTLDFVQGEIRYFSQHLREPGSTLLEAPPELICQDNFAPDMARGILRMAVQDILASGAAYHRWKQATFAIGRWVAPAMFADGITRRASAAVALYAYLAALVASMAGSRERLAVRFRLYIAALIRYQRLTCIRTERLSRAATGTPNAITGLDGNAVLDQTGFYPLEKYRGTQFRWSETVAAIRLRANAGRQFIRIKCVPVRNLSNEIDLRFYFNGKPVPDDAISTDVDDFEIHIDLPQSGTCKLGWICCPFRATADPRRLGLPIMGVELTSQTSHVMAADVNSQALRA
jgi:GT2 family glycosyltransferase